MRELSRCTGHCCKDFDLPFSPMQVENFKRRIAKGHADLLYDEGAWVKRYGVQSNDMETILEMLVFKRMDFDLAQQGKASARKGRYGSRRMRIYHYTCKHFDGKNCTIYNKRPKMCRTFPDAGKCDYKGCTRKCVENDEKLLTKAG